MKQQEKEVNEKEVEEKQENYETKIRELQGEKDNIRKINR